MSETPGTSQTPRPRAQRRRRSRRRIAVALVAVGLAGVLVAGAAVWTDTLGAGHLFDRAVARVDRFLAGPVPDRSAPGTVLVTGPDASDEPDEEDDPDASLGPDPSVRAGADRQRHRAVRHADPGHKREPDAGPRPRPGRRRHRDRPRERSSPMS